MNKFIFTLVSISGLLASAPASALVSKDVQNHSISLMKQHKAHEAYLLLNKQKKTSPQDWFLFGMAAKQSGDLLATKHAMQKVIRLDPQRSHRAKLELATAQFALEQTDDARRLLNEVKADNPPDNVRQNIDRFLSLIGDKNCHTNNNQRWCANASASVIYDSNVNNATTADSIIMFGLPFDLSDDAQAQSDTAIRVGANFDHIITISDKVAWQSAFSINFTDYSTLDRYDVLQLLASTGAVYQLNPKTLLSVPITAEAVAFTDRGELFSTTFGVSPQLRYKIDEKVSLNLNASISRRHFNNNGDRDTTSYSFSPSLDFSACDNGTFRIGGSIGRDDSGIDIFSNDNWQLSGSLFCSLGEGLALSVFGSYGQSDYDQREAAFTEAREENTRSIGANLRYENAENGWDITLGGTYTENDSNLTLYTYDRFQGTATIRKKF